CRCDHRFVESEEAMFRQQMREQRWHVVRWFDYDPRSQGAFWHGKVWGEQPSHGCAILKPPDWRVMHHQQPAEGALLTEVQQIQGYLFNIHIGGDGQRRQRLGIEQLVARSFEQSPSAAA